MMKLKSVFEYLQCIWTYQRFQIVLLLKKSLVLIYFSNICHGSLCFSTVHYCDKSVKKFGWFPLQSNILVLNAIFSTESFYMLSRKAIFLLFIVFYSILNISRIKLRFSHNFPLFYSSLPHLSANLVLVG